MDIGVEMSARPSVREALVLPDGTTQVVALRKGSDEYKEDYQGPMQWLKQLVVTSHAQSEHELMLDRVLKDGWKVLEAKANPFAHHEDDSEAGKDSYIVVARKG